MKRLYWLTAALLVVHEIDSAYWREWELFGLPGGVELFLALHVPLVLLVLWGYQQVIAGSRAGVRMAALVGALGVATGAVHGTFLARGAAEFRTPASLAVIVATVLAGAALLARAAKWTSEGSPFERMRARLARRRRVTLQEPAEKSVRTARGDL